MESGWEWVPSSSEALIKWIVWREFANRGHIDLHHRQAFDRQSLRDRRAEGVRGTAFEIRDIRQGRQLTKIRSLHSGEEPPPLRGRILDPLDDAIASIVHHHDDHVQIFLHGGPQFPHIQEEPAISGHYDSLPIARRGGGAQA